MKAVIFAAALLAAPFVAVANDPAYIALRVLGKTQGEDTLKHIIEVRGRNGVPQPASWKIVLDDPRARGGIRELEIEHGKIVSERTPLDHGAGGPMVLTQLNLDSEGAFTVANQEVQKQNRPYDHVDYVLRGGNGSGAPVWELNLTDSKHGHVATFVIAADTGNILHQEFDHGGDRDRDRDHYARRGDDRAYVEDRRLNPPPPPPTYVPPPDSSDDSDRGDGIHNVPDFFRRVQRHFEKRGRQLENFFTGKHSSDDRPPDERAPDDR